MNRNYEIREKTFNGSSYETANAWDVELKAGETPEQAFAREINHPTVQKDCAGSKLVMVEVTEDGTEQLFEEVI